MSNVERRLTDEPMRVGPPHNGVGVVSNDAAANCGPPKLPALPMVVNDNCKELEGVLGTEVKAVEDGGVVAHVSSSMGRRLPCPLVRLDPRRKQVRTYAQNTMDANIPDEAASPRGGASSDASKPPTATGPVILPSAC
jgi:hypothetical protein